MFIETIDQLRCLEPHDETWLVASLQRQHERFVSTGMLGCPICYREYPIRHGIAYFGVTPPDEPERPVPVHDPDMAMRAAALLNATERSTIVLTGSWAPHAHAITELVPLRVFALNSVQPMEDSESVALVHATGIPLGMMSVNGVALDAANATPAMFDAALRVLAHKGRLVAPADVAVPEGVQELARDAACWVGEVVHVPTSGLVALKRQV